MTRGTFIIVSAIACFWAIAFMAGSIMDGIPALGILVMMLMLGVIRSAWLRYMEDARER